MRSPSPHPKHIRSIALLLLLLTAAPLKAEEETIARNEATDEVNELGEGRRWIPEVSFPPVDPDSVEGYVYFWDRDLHIRLPRSDIMLSRKRGLEYTMKDNDFYLRLGGRIFIDYVNYFEDKNDIGDNGPGIRNFMVEINGRFTNDWLYRLSWGGFANGGKFDGSGAYLDDFYISYTGFDQVALTLGQQKEPFSLEQMGSSLATTFMERSLPMALTTGTNLGLSYSTYRNWWGLTGGLFAEDLAGGKDLGNQGYGLTGRIHFNPFHSETKTYHLGSSFSIRDISSSDDFFFRRRPESGLTDIRYVDTGSIENTMDVYRFNLEAALTRGPFSLQSEYIAAFVDREAGHGDLSFRGWYLTASWFPTGGNRKYFAPEGVFAYPDVAARYGEVELAARYSVLDLSDDPITGGREFNITFGINWYISAKMRLMANFILVNNDALADADGSLTGADNIRILQFRFQYRI